MSNYVGPDSSQADRSRYFEMFVWPHMTAAYSFARWMMRNHHDAEDVVQESFVKAFRAVDRLRGEDPRPWLLTIVRNTAINFLNRRRSEGVDHGENDPEPVDSAPNPEMSLAQRRRRERVRSAIKRLPVEFRETLVLREMEGMAYKEIAAVLKIPVGTVMSRLSRARDLLVGELVAAKETSNDLR